MDVCSVTKVPLHFFTARGCGGACFICVSEAEIRGAVQEEINCMGFKDFRQVCKLDLQNVNVDFFLEHLFTVQYCLWKVS